MTFARKTTRSRPPFQPGWFIQNRMTGAVYQVARADDDEILCRLLVSEKKWCVGQFVKIANSHVLRRVYADLVAHNPPPAEDRPARAQEYAAAGLSVPHIALVLNCSVETVYRALAADSKQRKGETTDA